MLTWKSQAGLRDFDVVEESAVAKGVPGCWAVTRGYRGRGPTRGLIKFSICGQKNQFIPILLEAAQWVPTIL